MPTLGLSMIVKNGGKDLRGCLASASKAVSQIVIADTGSTDNTREIAQEFGATVISAPWTNDFSAARNAALEPVTTDWVLALDADEELDEACIATLPSLLARTDVGSYIVTIRNYLPVRFACMYNSVSIPNDGRNPRAQASPSFTVHMNCRLFPRHPEIYFEGRVHERVEDRVRSIGLSVAKSDLLIHHFGQMASDEERLKKYIFYRELGLAKVNEQPENAMAWMELGLQEYEAFHNREQALQYFNRCLELDPKRTDAWTFVAMIQSELGNPQAALTALGNAGTDSNGMVLREQIRGDALHDLGRLQEARIAYRRAVKVSQSNPLLESKLGYTEVRLGMKQMGLRKLLGAIDGAPDRPELHDRLLKAYIAAEDVSSAAEVADKMASVFPSPKMFIRAASIRVHLKESAKAKDLIESGIQIFPDSEELKVALSQIQQSCSNV